MALTPQQIISLARKGTYKNYHATMEHYDAGTCPFCLHNGLDHTVNVIEYQNACWVIWQAPAALRPKAMHGLDRHIMIVPIRHVTSFLEFSPREWVTLWDALQWACQEYQIDAGFLFGRFGDIAKNGATELHFTFQIKVPNRDTGRKRMSEVFSKTEDEDVANMQREQRFGELYEQGVTPDQFAELMVRGHYDNEGTRFY